MIFANFEGKIKTKFFEFFELIRNGMGSSPLSGSLLMIELIGRVDSNVLGSFFQFSKLSIF